MKRYQVLEPYVPGELGGNTVMDPSVHPPAISQLHIVIDGWQGDCIMECFPSWIVTEEVANLLENHNCTGFSFCDLEVTISEKYLDFFGQREIPKFFWLKVDGKYGIDDIYVHEDFRLAVSDKVLSLFKNCGLPNCDIERL